MVGELLGSYRITSELSSGGMGTVWRATHELLGREAAIKLLRPELISSDELVQRFFNEAKAASAIRHPGIIEIYDFGYSERGFAYLVMEFLEGEALGKRLTARGRLTEREVKKVGRGIASALTAAHGKSIIHRDLKPDNVFLVPDIDGRSDRIKVLDFGIAKLSDVAGGFTKTGALMGTPLYMAPEQARAAGTIDHRADLYSLGCIMYELLVGEPPFVAEGAGEIIAMQLFTAPRPVRERVPEISVEMETIVMRLLAKEPHERFDSAGELYDALGFSAAESHPAIPAAGPATPTTALPRETRDTIVDPTGTRWGVVAIVAALIVVAAVIGVLLQRGAL